MIEIAAKSAVFHFNKKHLEDPSIPMWVIKCKGTTYYVNHVQCNVPWNTKENPEHLSTKGSISIKRVVIQIDDKNEALIRELTNSDYDRIRNKEKGITRVLLHNMKEIKAWLKKAKVKHKPIITVYGGCGSTYYCTDIIKQDDFALMSMTWGPKDFREVMPNEPLYHSVSEILGDKEDFEIFD